MKLAILAVFFSSVCICLAQTNQNNQSKNQAPDAQVQSRPQATMPCCKEMAGNKDAMSCCHHDSAAENAKGTMPCCSGKDAMPGMKGQDSKPDDPASGINDKKEGTKSDKDSKQAAMACCVASAGAHCGMQHHDHDSGAK
jgi:hypothetical protein